MATPTVIERLPQVSIVMPAYNAARYVAEAVASVQAQTYRQWELLVVDDCSTDATWEIVQRLSAEDARIRPLRMATNGGVAEARNTALRAARGRYVAFLDSDDLWLPRKLEVQLGVMQGAGVAFTFTRYRRMLGGDVGPPLPARDRVTYRDLLKGNPIGCLTVVIDRTVFPDITMPAVPHEDYAAWLCLLRGGGEARGIAEDLAVYRVNSASLSGNKARGALWTWKLYRDQEKLSLPVSLWNFAFYAGRAVTSRVQHMLHR